MKKIQLVVFSLFIITNIHAQNNIIASTALLHATYHHISVHVNIAGDVNLNADCTIEYKTENESNYHNSAKVMRAHVDMIVDGGMLNRNHFAGSAMFLEPNTTYDIRVTLDDPDGASPIVINEIMTTKAFPEPYQNGETKYVSPGNGGGQGTVDNPYLGLQSAADNANPGDIIMVSPGLYAAFEIRNNGAENMPITFKSENLHQAIIDGDNTDRGVVTVGDFDLFPAHHTLDGFIIQNGNWGVDAQNSSFLTVKNNIIRDVGFGFVNRRENNAENNQYIHNNLFEGRTAWPQLNGEIPGERAVDIRGNNNVVSFNTITDFGDGVSCDGAPYESSYSLDIYNNEISNIVDDFIEIDGNISNTRVYNNRGYNGRMGVSLAPVFGGPVYIFRNAFYNMEISTFKLNRGPAGVVIVHNLGIKTQNATSSDAGWQNTIIKNNILMGSRYCFEEYGQIDPATEDWDYNAYYSTRAATVAEPWFKWQNVKYATIQDLAANTSIESHGVATSLADLEIAYIPQIYGVSYNPADQDHQLSATSTLKDIGTTFDNLNEPYVLDGNPDIGPYEYGEPIPFYGAHFDDVIDATKDVVSETIAFHPTPTSGILHLSNMSNIESVLIYNNYGQLIKSFSVDSTESSIDLTRLQNGIYWLAFISEGGDFYPRKKVIIAH